MACIDELKRRKQTVEQANWKSVEAKVATELLKAGGSVEDIAAVIHEDGVTAVPGKKFVDLATPPNGRQTTGEALEHLKTLAKDDPGLMAAIEEAKNRAQTGETKFGNRLTIGDVAIIMGDDWARRHGIRSMRPGDHAPEEWRDLAREKVASQRQEPSRPSI
jgi:hypothetical protein